MNVDKIPIKEMIYSPGDNSYHLGSIEISKGEYANSQKINEIIDMLRDHEYRIGTEENK